MMAVYLLLAKLWKRRCLCLNKCPWKTSLGIIDVNTYNSFYLMMKVFFHGKCMFWGGMVDGLASSSHTCDLTEKILGCKLGNQKIKLKFWTMVTARSHSSLNFVFNLVLMSSPIECCCVCYCGIPQRVLSLNKFLKWSCACYSVQ